MSYDPGALDTALAAAVGENAPLIAELRGAFIDSAERHMAALAGSRCDANWRQAAARLQGLAASFGAVDLMRLANEAGQGAPGDPVVLRHLRAALASFGG